MGGRVLFVSPVLPVDVAQMASILERNGCLQRLVTRGALAPSERRWISKVPLLRLAARRPNYTVAKNSISRCWWADAIDLASRASGFRRTEAIDRSFGWLDRKASSFFTTKTAALLAREDACEDGFKFAQQRGILTLYQLPAPFCELVEVLLRREQSLFPEALDRAWNGDDFSPERVNRKRLELARADWVLCHSSFVRQSVERAGFLPDRIRVIPFGIDTPLWAHARSSRSKVFLYVGNISMRKGVHRLLRAWKRIGAYHTHRLRLIGEMQLSSVFLRDFRGMFEHVPRLPRESLPEHYASASAFVFNALADGFGHVIGEAMASGTAVLCSRNSGAPDLLTDGQDGRLFNFGDDAELDAILDWALSHPSQTQEMGRAGRARALECTWEKFEIEFMGWLRAILPPDRGATR